MNEERRHSRIVAFLAKYKRVAIIVGVLILMGIGALIYWLLSRGRESTDDAQIAGHMVMVTARVASHVRFINVDDTDRVQAGQLIVQLDRRDLLQTLRKAEADLASQRAQTSAAANQISVTQHTAPSNQGQAAAQTAIASQGINASETQVITAEAQVTTAQANVRAARDQAASARTDVAAAAAQVQAAQEAVVAAQADVVAAESQAGTQAREAERYRYLFNRGAISREQYESVVNTATIAQTSLRSARSKLATARVAVAQAIARRAGAEALLARANSQVIAALAALKQAQAGVRAAIVALRQAQYRYDQALAAQYGTETVPQQINISQEQRNAAAARIAQSAADVRTARLNLSYASIRAPVSGEVTNRAVEPGQYVQPGQTLMAVVPLNDVWVVANFKETQIGNMKPGQRADIEVDTYSGRHFHGKVFGIGAASGAQLSLLPPQNATGNFVKVVQRIPVRIVFEQPIPKGIVFRPGQNVVVTVYVR